jgi:hypothetical protein
MPLKKKKKTDPLLTPSWCRVVYLHRPMMGDVGQRLNLLLSRATADVVMHWDSDVYYGPECEINIHSLFKYFTDI